MPCLETPCQESITMVCFIAKNSIKQVRFLRGVLANVTWLNFKLGTLSLQTWRA